MTNGVVIETERLILRLPEDRDRAALAAMFGDAETMAQLGPVKDVAATDAALARHDADRREGLGFRVVERRADHAVVGFCGLKRGDTHNPIAGQIEAGWLIERSCWRQGYAFEAMAAVLAWGWDNTGATRIVAITSAINDRSQRLMRRLGMMPVAGGDFDHARMPADDPLRAMVTFAINRPRGSAG